MYKAKLERIGDYERDKNCDVVHLSATHKSSDDEHHAFLLVKKDLNLNYEINYYIQIFYNEKKDKHDYFLMIQKNVIHQLKNYHDVELKRISLNNSFIPILKHNMFEGTFEKIEEYKRDKNYDLVNLRAKCKKNYNEHRAFLLVNKDVNLNYEINYDIQIFCHAKKNKNYYILIKGNVYCPLKNYYEAELKRIRLNKLLLPITFKGQELKSFL